MSYITVSTVGVLNTTNNETAFPKLRSVFENSFEIKVQEVSVLRDVYFRIFESPLGFSVYHTDHIMELVY